MTDSARLYEQLAQDAARIIQQVTGASAARIERIPHGMMTHKFAVSLASGARYVVRFYPPSRAFVVNYEPDVVGRCAQAGAPVPEVIVDSRTGPAAALSYMAYRMVDGVTLAERIESLDTNRLLALCRQLAERLSTMRQLRFDGFGELIDGRRANSATWSEFVSQSFHAGLSAVRDRKLLDADTTARLANLGQRLDEFSRCESSQFNWGDFRPQNILLDDQDRLASLLDFEGALAGDPLLTLGYGYAAFGDQPFFREFAAFWPGEVDRPQLYFYSVLRLLRIAKYAGQPLPTGQPRAALASIFPGFASALDAL